MNILITGYSGFIGKNLIEKIINDKKYNLLLIGKQKKLNYKNCKYIISDLANIRKYKKKIINFQPDIVIHLAWYGIPKLNKLNSIYNLNISINFFEIIFNYTKCKKIIVTGSCFEYCKSKGKINENYSNNVDNYFAWSKNSLLKFLNIYCSDNKINLYWLRLFYVFGKFQRNESIIPILINNAKLNKHFKVKYPYNRNDFIYINDVINAIEKCINNKVDYCGALNIGSGKAVAINTIQNYINKKFGNKKISKYNLNQNVTNNFYADISLAKKILNWSPKYDYKTGIQDLI
tara:strand:- start:3259 stop:4128 length:870 start_codon:yes stop_codon:yes gene_type:complete